MFRNYPKRQGEDMSDFLMLIKGKPIGKERPRFARVGNGVRTYTAEKTKNYEFEIQLRAKQLMTGKSLYTGPLRVQMVVSFPIPKTWSKAKAQDALNHVLKPITKPDLDNVIKLILDALNGIVYNDDSQVVELIVKKIYHIDEGSTLLTIDQIITNK